MNRYTQASFIVQELCESRGGRRGLSVLTSLLASVDVKIYCTMLTSRIGLSLSLICQPTSEDIRHHFIGPHSVSATERDRGERTSKLNGPLQINPAGKHKAAG